MSIDELRQYLSELIEKSDFDSIRQLAREAGVNHSYISRILSGGTQNPPSPKILEKLARVLPTTHTELMDKAGHITIVMEPSSEAKYDTTKKIPILKEITPERPIFFDDHIIDYKRVPVSEVDSGQYFYFKMKDDSMNGGGILKGDLLLVKKQKEIKSGKIFVVITGNDRAKIRKVFNTNGQLLLQAENPNYDPVVASCKDVKIIGKVVSLRREYE